MAGQWRRRLLAALAIGVGVPSGARALDLERLVMPGEVIRAHADLEDDCGQCHAAFRAGDQDRLCRDCHEPVDADIAAGRGFHGRAPGAAQAACRTCHPEHRGRDADAVGLNHEAFDHALTDHPLEGAHRDLACGRCHESAAKFRDAPGDCFACHEGDDPHDGRLGRSCGDCHGESRWRDARFDHGATSFPLTGGHRDVACGLCHPGERYENTASDCRACHAPGDVHMGAFGNDCAGCHDSRGWSRVRFDHDRDTGFALTGRHRDAACASCHLPGASASDLASDCVSCHRGDDVHRGRNGRDCGDCHDTASWDPRKFDHDRMTDFPLRGAHEQARCGQCHRGKLHEEKLPGDCFSCHRDDDVHRGQQGRDCSSCHDEANWEHRVSFDHDLTRFPLLGLHAVAACDQCHLSPRFRDADARCASCHRDDDVHLLRLGPGCARCHNPNGWRIWRFDHAAETSFALDGAHADLDCHACHQVPVDRDDRVGLRGGCDGCHARDDVHHGAYGRDCARCHGESSWRDLRMGR